MNIVSWYETIMAAIFLTTKLKLLWIVSRVLSRLRTFKRLIHKNQAYLTLEKVYCNYQIYGLIPLHMVLLQLFLTDYICIYLSYAIWNDIREKNSNVIIYCVKFKQSVNFKSVHTARQIMVLEKNTSLIENLYMPSNILNPIIVKYPFSSPNMRNVKTLACLCGIVKYCFVGR